MGASKGGGFQKLGTLTPGQNQFADQSLANSSQFAGQAGSAFNKYLSPEGTQGIQNQALNRYNQQILPSIMNQFGSSSKSSSALNQALAASGKDLTTDIQALIEQLGLTGAQGLGSLSASQGQQGITPRFGYQQPALPFWQQLLLGGIGGASNGLGQRRF